ncbi:hypothetical protein X975_20723, partial [Stegodyphus mimosarum]
DASRLKCYDSRSEIGIPDRCKEWWNVVIRKIDSCFFFCRLNYHTKRTLQATTGL